MGAGHSPVATTEVLCFATTGRDVAGLLFFFFKQKTAYEIGWCDWSSDVCSSDLLGIFGLSDEERRKRIVQNDPTHYDNALWLAIPELKPLSSNRTSLIYDPPDGKIPPLTPDAVQRAAARRAAGGFDSYENRPLSERCIMLTHEGPPMLPPAYNDVLQIIQTPGYVLVIREMETAPRLIPTDGRPHLSENIRRWAGD